MYTYTPMIDSLYTYIYTFTYIPKYFFSFRKNEGMLPPPPSILQPSSS